MHKTFWKKDQLKNRKTINSEPVKKESDLQLFVDKYLEMKMVDYIRIPDYLWWWLKTKCPMWLLKLCSKHLAGWCDNIPIIPITKECGLVCLIENKSSKGKLHGKQKKMANRLNYHVVRSENEAIETINKFIEDAESIKKILGEKNG